MHPERCHWHEFDRRTVQEAKYLAIPNHTERFPVVSSSANARKLLWWCERDPGAFVVRADESVDDLLAFRPVEKRAFSRTAVDDLSDEAPH